MAKTLTADICVIGAGPAGMAVAMEAAARGVRVVLVDRQSPADNLMRGSLATAALCAAADRAQSMRSAGPFGLEPAEPGIDFRKVLERASAVASQACASVSPARLSTLGIVFVQSEARFAGRRRLLAGDSEIRARRYVLATGARPVEPVIDGLEEAGFLTPDTVFRLDRLPERLVVLGGDAEGLQLAQAFRRLGSEVTVLCQGRILPSEDPEMTAVVLRGLRAEGISLREGIEVSSVEGRGGDGIRVSTQGEAGAGMVVADRLLLAFGRRADLSGLDLRKARIALKDDAVDVSAMLRTTNRRIYAVGDVVGTRSSHAARHQAARVLRALLFRLPAKDRTFIPRVVGSDPQLAHVGLTEAEAARRYGQMTILRSPFADNDCARASRSAQGHIKLVLARNGDVLGATIVGAQAAEMIGTWAMAVSRKLSLKDVAFSMPAHPTMAEIGKDAAISYFSGRRKGRLMRNGIRLLRFFG